LTSGEAVWSAISEQRPDLLAKAMESYAKLEAPVKARP
jgi:hypothetical protein